MRGLPMLPPVWPDNSATVGWESRGLYASARELGGQDMDYDRPYRHRRTSRTWPTWLYYLTAAVLVLLTMPMYHVILGSHERGASSPVVAASPSVAQRLVSQGVADAVAPMQQQQNRNFYEIQARARQRTPAALGRRLASNERCIGGSIVRVDDVRGVPTYTQETDGAHPVACPQPH